MSIQIEISDYTANALKDSLIKELTEKREKLKLFESECNNIEVLIAQLNEANNLFSDEASFSQSSLANDLGYKKNMTWEGKIKFILDYKGNVGLTTSEIVAVLIQLEPKYSIKEDRSKAVACISAVLSTNSKNGKTFYKKISERNENVYYISPF